MRARVSGYLLSQEYTEGAFVKSGDLLFRIDARPYQAAVDEAEGNHALAQAQVEQAKAQLAQAQAQVEQAKAQIAQAQADVTKAQANQRRTQLDVDKYARWRKTARSASRSSTRRRRITSPIRPRSCRPAPTWRPRAPLLRMQAAVKAQADLARAQANVQAMKAALDNARLNLGWTRVTSPIDGLAGCATSTSATW